MCQRTRRTATRWSLHNTLASPRPSRQGGDTATLPLIAVRAIVIAIDLLSKSLMASLTEFHQLHMLTSGLNHQRLRPPTVDSHAQLKRYLEIITPGSRVHDTFGSLSNSPHLCSRSPSECSGLRFHSPVPSALPSCLSRLANKCHSTYKHIRSPSSRQGPSLKTHQLTHQKSSHKPCPDGHPTQLPK